MKKQKWLAGMVMGFLFGGVSFATYSGKEKVQSGWKTPVYSGIDFAANLSDGNVLTEWSRFTPPNGEKFKYYKVTRSTTNSNPVYPEDGYIKYSGDIDFLSYTDSFPKSAYYRVCAMTHEKGRYCSNVIKIDVGDIDQHKYEKKKETTKTYEKKAKSKEPTSTNDSFSWEVQKKLDKWLNTLDAKLKSSDLTSAQKVVKIDNIKNALEQIAKKRSVYWPLVNYLNPKLKVMQENFKQDDLSDLDSLLD